MTLSQFERPLIGILAMLLITGALTEAHSLESPKLPSKTNESVVELLQKRRGVLSQLVKVQKEAYRKGEASIEALSRADQELLAVELELATTNDERINLLEKAVQLTMDFEKIVATQYEAARASQADVLKSQAARLRAETLLLRERQKLRKN